MSEMISIVMDVLAAAVVMLRVNDLVARAVVNRSKADARELLLRMMLLGLNSINVQ